MKYANILNLRKTLQIQPLEGSGQFRNLAGGYAWSLDEWQLLDRFLILGSESGTYYVSEQRLTLSHAKNLQLLVKSDGVRVVERVVELSASGRAPKNDPALFALAVAASEGSDETRRRALAALPRVARTGTHLFTFADNVDALRGWGRGLRRAVANWYLAQSTEDFELALIKYRQRGGWSHRDLLRLAHPKATSAEQDALFRYAVRGDIPASAPRIAAVAALQEATTAERVADLIREFRLPREAVPTEWLKDPVVWTALLEEMPITAMIRNLGNLSKAGVLVDGYLESGSEATEMVLSALADTDRLRRARIHPLGVLIALATYRRGQGVRGSGEWKPVPSVIKALERAFYASFANVVPTGKRFLLGLDVSGSMDGTLVSGAAGISCREACGAMAMVTDQTESETTHVAFDTNAYPLQFSAKTSLEQVIDTLARTGGGGTDCAKPIQWALKNRKPVDVFVIYTDSETWYGQAHPAEMVQKYRRSMGIDAKLVVVAMASTRTTIADPGDKGVLNVVGFDASVPEVIRSFVMEG